MIKIHILKQNNQIKEVTISGHSGYAELGKDIVCASISSIVVTTVNGILSISDTIKASDDGHILKIEVLENDEITEKLLINMIQLFEGIECQYKKNVSIRTEEKNKC